MADFIAQYWIAAAFGIISTGVGIAFRKIFAIRHGVQALLRDRIVQAYFYYMDRKYCPLYALETIQALYDQYHALGGNGAITKLVEDVKKLPAKDPH